MQKIILILVIILTFASGTGATENYDFQSLPDVEVTVGEVSSDDNENVAEFSQLDDAQSQQGLAVTDFQNGGEAELGEVSELPQVSQPDDIDEKRANSFKRQVTIFSLIFACGLCVLYLIVTIYKNYFVKEQIFHEKILADDDNSLLTPENVNLAVRQFLRKMK